MEILPIQTKSLKIFSKGIEEKYTGKTIVYHDKSKVFVFYYFKTYKKAYILKNSSKNGVELPYIEGKVEILASFEDKKAQLFAKYMDKAVLLFGNNMFVLKDIMYLKIYCIIMKFNSHFEDIEILLSRKK